MSRYLSRSKSPNPISRASFVVLNTYDTANGISAFKAFAPGTPAACRPTSAKSPSEWCFTASRIEACSFSAFGLNTNSKYSFGLPMYGSRQLGLRAAGKAYQQPQTANSYADS